MYYIYYMLIFHKKNMLCICCNARESRTIAEILKSKFGQFHVKSPGETSTLKKIDFYSLFHLYIIILAQKASF